MGKPVNKVDIVDKFAKYLFTKNPENADVVQIIELALDYLNAETIGNYSKNSGLSYNGVKKCREVVNSRIGKYVIDNE